MSSSPLMDIVGIGTAVPEHVMTQREAVELAHTVCCQTDQQAALVRVLYRRSNIDSRHTVVPHRTALRWTHPHGEIDGGAAVRVETLGPSTSERMELYREHAPPLAVRASAAALEQSRIDAKDVAHLVTVTCTGFAAPGVDVALITQLGLRPTVERTHIGFMGCHGAINALRVARALAAAEPQACVLVCAVELCSLHYLFQWDPTRIVGNAIFADGAAAVMCKAAAESSIHAAAAWRVAAAGSCLMPDAAEAIAWHVGDHGFEMTLSPRVPDLIREHLRPWLEAWLAKSALTLADVGSWAVHPGGPRIVSAVEESLGLVREATAVSREVLRQFGNMSSPTVLFILERLRAAGAARPCVLLGFGPGLVAEAALVV